MILDVGCGVHPKGDVNCDRRKLRGIRDYVICDANHLPFRTQSFEMVCAFNLLEHVDNPPDIIRECCRVGGLCKFSVDSLLNPLNYLHPEHSWLTFKIGNKICFLRRPRILAILSRWIYKCFYGNQSVYKVSQEDRKMLIDPWLIKRHIVWTV